MDAETETELTEAQNEIAKLSRRSPRNLQRKRAAR